MSASSYQITPCMKSKSNLVYELFMVKKISQFTSYVVFIYIYASKYILLHGSIRVMLLVNYSIHVNATIIEENN